MPAGTNRPAFTPVTNTRASTLYDQDNDENGVDDFGEPITGTMGTPSPPHYYHSPSPNGTPPSLHPAAGDTEAPHPRVAEWRNGTTPTNRSRPCASDYCDNVKRTILKACGRYEIFIVAEEVFPDHDIQLAKAREFFTDACTTFGVEYQVTDRILGIVSTHVSSSIGLIINRICPQIKARGSRIRGAIHTSAQIRGDSKFGFIPRPGSKKGIAKNKKKAELLLENDCFCWRVSHSAMFSVQIMRKFCSFRLRKMVDLPRTPSYMTFSITFSLQNSSGASAWLMQTISIHSLCPLWLSS